MKRRGFMQMLSGLVALAPTVSKAKPEATERPPSPPSAPIVTCPQCGADQTNRAWYAGVADADGKSEAVCEDCQAREMGGIGQYVATNEPDDDRDLCDLIYDISPMDTPFCNRRGKRDRRL